MAFALVLGIVVLSLIAIAAALGRSRAVRFRFEEHEDHVVLEIDREVQSDDAVRITMSALREAVRLKLLSDYKRILVDVRRASVEDESAFWLLVGGLGPLFLSDGMRIALLCRPRTPIGKRFRESALAPCFASQAEALTFLRSAEIAPRVTLDRDWVESLLLARRPSAPRLRKAA